MKRCRRLRPNGVNGFGTGGAETLTRRGSAAFAGLFGVGDNEAGTGTTLAHNEDALDEDELRAIFDRFDANKDGMLDPEEFTLLLQQMMPSRANDFDEPHEPDGGATVPIQINLMDGATMTLKLTEFKKADTDGNGGIDFAEFCTYWRSVAASNAFDEAADMFRFCDKDANGELDRAEFLQCLHNLFPEHCDDNEAHVAEEFASADLDASDGISFPEFVMYYQRLQGLYAKQTSDEEKAARSAAAKVERRKSLDQPLVTCKCGKQFLVDKIAVHQRACEVCAPPAASGHAAGDESGGGGGGGGGGFVPCEFCGRTFFPDRLPKHLRVCKAKQAREGSSGIRPTMTDGINLTRGAYE